MAKTAVGGDDDRPKSFLDKVKNSPAAKQYKEKGAKSVAKTLGGMAKDVVKHSANKASDALGLSSPSYSPEAWDHADNQLDKSLKRDRGNVTGRKSHFVSSYHNAKALKQNLTCATCAVEDITGGRY